MINLLPKQLVNKFIDLQAVIVVVVSRVLKPVYIAIIEQTFI